MLIVSLLSLFALACACAWLLLFPLSRERLAESAQGLLGRLERQFATLTSRGARQAGSGALMAGQRLLGTARFLRHHLLALLAAAVLLTVPPLLAWLVSGDSMLGRFADDSPADNLQARALLQGEQLAPPQPLPPLVFATAEVVQQRPLLDSANRNWQLLDQSYAQRLLLVFRIMKEQHGYDMAILEGYRSPERQNLLAASGSGVTNARAFQSYHQYGLAADCAFVRDGRLLISEKDAWAMRGYRLYGEVAESLGLRWGGRWTLMDFGHTELRLPGRLGK